MPWPGAWPLANCSKIQRSGIPYLRTRSPGAADDTYFDEDWTPNLVYHRFGAIVAWSDTDAFISDMIGQHQKVGT
jgi:hypothetical protein